MRCPKCGAMPNTLLVGIGGKKLYYCTRPIHHLEIAVKGKRVEFYQSGQLCGTAIDERGQEYHGYFEYVTDDIIRAEKF